MISNEQVAKLPAGTVLKSKHGGLYVRLAEEWHSHKITEMMVVSVETGKIHHASWLAFVAIVDICPKCGREGGEYTPTLGACAFC